ncbi:hypothetical protein E4Z66_14400 [Aliishimia ponticola]|uniref:DUF4136 domain-containing protein n=1 Tax=Aliishimia ponticola TaxID=2499833 RepID=A0A4S4NG32_9RHOB|nr:hypothetical protein [Aliishimia ponticola]THH35020.1 hypothetical protein E4Z66_14400 [Aliishimia ponticola]
MFRFALVSIFALALAACSPSGRDLDEPAVPLGDFKLGHNVVVAPKAVRGPLSRKASEKELTSSLTEAIAARFDRYEGEKLYHFGVSVEGYVLAAPGVPLVYSPKSIMIINVTVWDDAANRKLNEKPEQITVFESLSGETIISSGLTQSRQQQLENLSINAAKQIELFLQTKMKEEGWFGAEIEETIIEETTR